MRCGCCIPLTILPTQPGICLNPNLTMQDTFEPRGVDNFSVAEIETTAPAAGQCSERVPGGRVGGVAEGR